MINTDDYHTPVLLNETLAFLNIHPGGKYIDCTLGGGGHSEGIIRLGGRVLGIDRDTEAIAYAKKRLVAACPTTDIVGGQQQTIFRLVLGNFNAVSEIAKNHDFYPADGILYDLGVSSHQLETPDRGFSFNQGGDLDMRMGPDTLVTAKELINVLTEGELDELFTKLGEEKYSRRFSRAICRARRIKPIETCDELAKVIINSSPPRGRFDRTHPATRVFQSLRIAVNDELNSLSESLPQAAELLNRNGRLVVISFHSLEDAIVKRYFQKLVDSHQYRLVISKPETPPPQEVSNNPRSRSAKQRVIEKL